MRRPFVMKSQTDRTDTHHQQQEQYKTALHPTGWIQIIYLDSSSINPDPCGAPAPPEPALSSCLTLPRPLVPSYLVSLAPSGTNYRTYARSPPSLTDSVAGASHMHVRWPSSQVADLATVVFPTMHLICRPSIR